MTLELCSSAAVSPKITKLLFLSRIQQGLCLALCWSCDLLNGAMYFCIAILCWYIIQMEVGWNSFENERWWWRYWKKNCHTYCRQCTEESEALVFLPSICNRWYLRGGSQLSSRDKLFTSLVFQLWWFAPSLSLWPMSSSRCKHLVRCRCNRFCEQKPARLYRRVRVFMWMQGFCLILLKNRFYFYSCVLV